MAIWFELESLFLLDTNLIKIVESDEMKHKKLSNTEKEYLKGNVHNLSLQRLTDQEIVNYLNSGYSDTRTTVNGIKNRIEKEAEKWYVQLRQSRYKYIANYKERLDALFTYQKKLNEIVEKRSEADLEIAIRAITEIHRIEISILNLWKQLPQMDLENPNTTGFQTTMSFTKCIFLFI
jgi:hypothetical protein